MVSIQKKMKTVKLILRLKARKSEVSVIKNSSRRCPTNCDNKLLKYTTPGVTNFLNERFNSCII